MLSKVSIELAEARRKAAGEKFQTDRKVPTFEDIINSLPPELLERCTIKKGEKDERK
jgi:hypothetical protein